MNYSNTFKFKHMPILVQISKAMEALNPTKEEVSSMKVERKSSMGLYVQATMKGLDSLPILRRCVEIIEKSLDTINEKEGSDDMKARYANLDRARKKLLFEYGDLLHELRSLPVGKMLISSSAFDFGDSDCYHFGDLLQFIRRKTREEDVSYWTEKTDVGCPRSVMMLGQLMFVLRQELIGLSYKLQSANPNHNETITKINTNNYV